MGRKFKKIESIHTNTGVTGDYCPPEKSTADWVGKPVLSASVWIPKELVENKEMFIRSATIQSVNDHTGQVSYIPLAYETGHHIVVARHFFTDLEWRKKLCNTPDLGWNRILPTWEKFDFKDKVVPRDKDQEQAWEAFRGAENGVLNLACGKGKTVLALKKIADRGCPAIVIVNNSALMEQWKDRALEFLDISEEDIGIVQGSTAEWDKPLVLGMIHTLANRATEGVSMEIRQRFGTIIFDEVHHLAASKFVLTAPLFFGNRYGLTATPNREDGLEDIYYAHVGRIFYSDLTGDLNAKVYFHRTSTSLPTNESVIRDKTGEFSAGKMYQYFSEHDERNNCLLGIVEDALDKGRKILVLTHSKDHPERLKDKLLDRGGMKRYTVGAVSGATAGDERIKIIEEADVTFATFQIAREGLDVAALDTLIFATPFKSWGAFQQGKGRVEREHRGKKDPIVVVLDDYLFGPAGAMCRNLRRNVVARGIRVKSVN